MNYMAFSGLVNGLCAFTLAILVYWKCPRRDLGISYAAMNFCISFWSFCYMSWQFSTSIASGYFRMQMLQTGVVLINQALLVFVSVLLGMTPRRKRFIWLAAAINLIAIGLHWSGLLYEPGPYIPTLGYWPHWTVPFSLYVGFWYLELLYALLDLIHGMRTSIGVKHQQLRYLVAAFGIGYFGGIFSWLPWFGIFIIPYPNILVSLYTLIVAYAILRHRLMDIQIILRRTLLYSLVSAVLVCVYASTVTLCARLLEGHVLRPSVYSSAAAAAAIALMFYPLSKGFGRWLDQKFFQHELDRWRREYAGALVHEIKTPLAAISLPAELTLRDAQDLAEERVSGKDVGEKIQNRMAVIMERAQQASQRLDGIHALMGLNPRHYQPVSLAKSIEAACFSLRDLFLRHHVYIVLPALPSGQIKGSAEQLEMVFTNLLKNAVEAMDQVLESKRTLTVEVEQKRKQIIIRIRDQGPGFTFDHDQLFKPFFSTKGAAERGIGLFLCRQIILAHAGTIEAHNHPEGGAEFEIRLPLT